jgi:hypothetical protein
MQLMVELLRVRREARQADSSAISGCVTSRGHLLDHSTPARGVEGTLLIRDGFGRIPEISVRTEYLRTATVYVVPERDLTRIRIRAGLNHRNAHSFKRLRSTIGNSPPTSLKI